MLQWCVRTWHWSLSRKDELERSETRRREAAPLYLEAGAGVKLNHDLSDLKQGLGPVGPLPLSEGRQRGWTGSRGHTAAASRLIVKFYTLFPEET